MLETDEGSADDRAADAHGTCQVALDQALVGLQSTGDDVLAQAVLRPQWDDPGLVKHLVHPGATYHGPWRASSRAAPVSSPSDAPRQVLASASSKSTLALASAAAEHIPDNTDYTVTPSADGGTM